MGAFQEDYKETRQCVNPHQNRSRNEKDHVFGLVFFGNLCTAELVLAPLFSFKVACGRKSVGEFDQPLPSYECHEHPVRRPGLLDLVFHLQVLDLTL